MKRQLLIILFVLLVSLFITSCEGDWFINFMNETEKNLFIENGLVPLDTSAADNVFKATETKTVEVTDITEDKKLDISNIEELKSVTEAIKAITGADTGSDTSVELKLDYFDEKNEKIVEVISKGILAPQTEEQKQTLNASLAETVNSPSKTKDLKEKLEKEVSEDVKVQVKGSMAFTASILKTITAEIKEDDDNTAEELKNVKAVLDNLAADFVDTATNDNAKITEADKVQIQIVTNIAVSAANATAKLKDAEKENKNPLEIPEVKALINDTATLYNVAKISAGNIDIAQTQGLFDSLLTNNSGTAKGIDIGDKEASLVTPIVRQFLVDKNEDVNSLDARLKAYKLLVQSRLIMFSVIKDVKDVNVAKLSPELKNNSTAGSILEYFIISTLSTFVDSQYNVKYIDKDTNEEVKVDIVTFVKDVLSSTEFSTSAFELESEKYDDVFDDDSKVQLAAGNFDNIKTNYSSKAYVIDKMLEVSKLSFNDVLGKYLESADISADSGTGLYTYIISKIGEALGEESV